MADVSRLPEKVQASVQEYVALLQALAGDELAAVTVIGEAAEPGASFVREAVRNVVVLRQLALEFVSDLGAQGASMGKMGIQAPLVMTPEYIASSRDVFPIELLEIQQQHVNVFGEDYFVPLEFARSDVRLQLEHELKRELIQIRQGILSAGGKDKVLAELYRAAAEQTLRLLRAVLWLHGRPAASTPAGIAQSVASVSGVALGGLKPALEGARELGFPAVQDLYESVLGLANHVDGMAV